MTATLSLMPFAVGWDFSAVQELLGIVLRVVLAGVAAVGTYYLSGPFVGLLYRLAFQRPIPVGVAGWARLGCGVLVGVLVFFLLPYLLGGGGSGWGLGGSGGGGIGKDKGRDKTNGKEGQDKSKDGKETGKNGSEIAKTLTIEIVLSPYYQSLKGPCYLIHEPNMPKKMTVAEYKDKLKTLDEVKDYLTIHKDKLRRVNILIYSDSLADSFFGGVRVTHPAVTQLERSISNLGLAIGREEAWLKEKKPDLEK